MDTLQALANIVRKNEWNALCIWWNGYDNGWGASITGNDGNALATGLGPTIQGALEHLLADPVLDTSLQRS